MSDLLCYVPKRWAECQTTVVFRRSGSKFQLDARFFSEKFMMSAYCHLCSNSYRSSTSLHLLDSFLPSPPPPLRLPHTHTHTHTHLHTFRGWTLLCLSLPLFLRAWVPQLSSLSTIMPRLVPTKLATDTHQQMWTEMRYQKLIVSFPVSTLI